MDKIIFNLTESGIIKTALLDHLVTLKLNNGSQSLIQKMQQIIDKMPKMNDYGPAVTKENGIKNGHEK